MALLFRVTPTGPWDSICPWSTIAENVKRKHQRAPEEHLEAAGTRSRKGRVNDILVECSRLFSWLLLLCSGNGRKLTAFCEVSYARSSPSWVAAFLCFNTATKSPSSRRKHGRQK